MDVRPVPAAVLTGGALLVLTLWVSGVGLLAMVVVPLAFLATLTPVVVPAALFVHWARRRGYLE